MLFLPASPLVLLPLAHWGPKFSTLLKAAANWLVGFYLVVMASVVVVVVVGRYYVTELQPGAEFLHSVYVRRPA
jgi:hypothetical protein